MPAVYDDSTRHGRTKTSNPRPHDRRLWALKYKPIRTTRKPQTNHNGGSNRESVATALSDWLNLSETWGTQANGINPQTDTCHCLCGTSNPNKMDIKAFYLHLVFSESKIHFVTIRRPAPPCSSQETSVTRPWKLGSQEIQDRCSLAYLTESPNKMHLHFRLHTACNIHLTMT